MKSFKLVKYKWGGDMSESAEPGEKQETNSVGPCAKNFDWERPTRNSTSRDSEDVFGGSPAPAVSLEGPQRPCETVSSSIARKPHQTWLGNFIQSRTSKRYIRYEKNDGKCL